MGNEESTVWLEDFTQTMAGTPINDTEGDGAHRLKSDACTFGKTQANVYLMASVDAVVVVGNPSTTKPFLEQFN
eukprot:6095233-Amphidinium_carterae.1